MSKTLIKPLNDRVLLLPDEPETITASGIILTGVKEKPATGTIIVGGELVKKGDHVLFSKFAFDEVEIEKKTYYLISESSLLGIFN